MKYALLSITLILSLLVTGCFLKGDNNSTGAIINEFLGALRTEVNALGVVVSQEFIKAADEGILIVVREKDTGRMICQTTFDHKTTVGVLTQLMPFVRTKGITYQVQLSMGPVSTPWTDI